MGIRVILMDVDGTLVKETRDISPKTKAALLKAQEKGVLLVLASGRPYTGLIELGKELEMDKHHGLFVCFNGSKVVDFQSGEVLFNQTMSVEEGKAVLEHMKKFKVHPMIDKDDYMYVNDVYDCFIKYKGEDFNVIQYEARGGSYKLCEQSDLAAFLDFPLNKILTAGDGDYLQAHYQEMMEPFKERLNCMFTASFYFEFTAKGVDKAKAIDSVLVKLGYSREEMIAFGDSPNDASMLEYAGRGIAMGNAVEELKKIADEVTKSNEEDGIAYSLYKHMSEVFE